MSIVVNKLHDVSEKNFFEDFRGNIERYTRYIQGTPAPNAQMKGKMDIVMASLADILNHSDEYSALGRLTIHYIGNRFREDVTSREVSESNIQSILVFLSRIYREHSIKKGVVPNPPAQNILDYFSLSNPELSYEEKHNADYIWNRLPVNLLEETLTNINEEKKRTIEKIKSWQNDLTELEERVKNESSKLEEQKQHYNFVGLSSAFQNLLSQKKDEKLKLFVLLCFSGITLLAPPIIYYLKNVAFQPKSWMDYTVAVLPFAAIDLILLYFFRIFLQNFYSAKAQILQLELRYSLCAFIESYVDFIKEKDNGKQGERKLEKFEALIFSGLSPDINNVPSTFDGLEQLTKIIKDLK